MKKQNNSRRNFIKTTALSSVSVFIKTTALSSVSVSIGLASAGAFLESCNSSKKISGNFDKTGFNQQALPYSFDALEDVVDAKTMEIHYSKHAASYSKSLKERSSTGKIC